MLERLVADVLVRVLGQYVHGISRETVSIGVWSGRLELHNLAIRADALAVLFETLGLDLPVTVVAGYVGTLCLEVPWKSLRSSPVQVTVGDLSVVAAPVTDGDQSALAAREARLKAARLETDDAVREARFSMDQAASAAASKANSQGSRAGTSTESYRITRWSKRVSTAVFTTILNNIQINVNNIVVQYQDASSVPGHPYTVDIALSSVRAVSTNSLWEEEFVTDTEAPTVFKALYISGFVANWCHGTGDTSHQDMSTMDWADRIRAAKSHVIDPLQCELRIAFTSQEALTEQKSSDARVHMDLCFPDVAFKFDEFQYHALLSSIAYLSDIDRKVRPRTPRERWRWAVERLLPRFQTRQRAREFLTVEGLRQRREEREQYVRVRKRVVRTRRAGRDPESLPGEATTLREMETSLLFSDILLYRDIVDTELKREAEAEEASGGYGGIWRLLPGGPLRRSASASSDTRSNNESAPAGTSGDMSSVDGDTVPARSESAIITSDLDHPRQPVDQEYFASAADDDLDADDDDSTGVVKMAFLLAQGSIQLCYGGGLAPAQESARFEFHELRLGVSTWSDGRLLVDGLLGTLDVVDAASGAKVMYPRAHWTGSRHMTDINVMPRAFGRALSGRRSSSSGRLRKTSSSQSTDSMSLDMPLDGDQDFDTWKDLRSYPSEIENALAQIRRGCYKPEGSLFVPTSSGLDHGLRSEVGPSGFNITGSPSSTSLQNEVSSVPRGNREDLTAQDEEPMDYVVALRLYHERATPSGPGKDPVKRLAMDLAIGGLEAIVDGPEGAFVAGCTFWHPKQKLPSIMTFLSRAAAPRLAALRMDLERALRDRKAPMRMDITVRAPRFVVPGPQDLSLVVDFGTFVLETSDSIPFDLPSEYVPSDGRLATRSGAVAGSDLELRCTDYRMSASDLGLYLITPAGKHAAERLVRPFSIRILLQVLHDAAYVEAVADEILTGKLAKTRLFGQLPMIKTIVSHAAFRHILDIVQQWNTWIAETEEPESSAKPPVAEQHENKSAVTLTQSPLASSHSNDGIYEESSGMVPSRFASFDMRLELDDLNLELRDGRDRRIVTLSSVGTRLKLCKTPMSVSTNYKVREFCILDGSRGATAPFRRLVYAGTTSRPVENDNPTESMRPTHIPGADANDGMYFVDVSYANDLHKKRQKIAFNVLSLSMVCVRETYLALVDFFYLARAGPGSVSRAQAPALRTSFSTSGSLSRMDATASADEAPVSEVYADPFQAVGMTTSTAVRALRDGAERGVEMSKQAFASRGQLQVSAHLDGMDVTLVTAEGSIASFDIHDCSVRLQQSPQGDVSASGEFGGFSVCDRTAAFALHSQVITYTNQSAMQPPPGETALGDDKSLARDGFRFGTNALDTSMHLSMRLSGLRIVYLHRFIVIIKQYITALRKELQPVLSMKGGLLEAFDEDVEDPWFLLGPTSGPVALNVSVEDVDIIMPRHSQSPHEGLRFCVGKTSITNDELAAPGYLLGFKISASEVDTYVLYDPMAPTWETEVSEEELQRCTVNAQDLSFGPRRFLVPFSEGIAISAKLDLWRSKRVPKVILNDEGIPVVKDGQKESDFDPQTWKPTLRARISAPNGITARLCEAEYTVLYFVFTENIIERPDIEFTDIIRGLKTPILPPRRPIEPLRLSSDNLPPSYSILFEIPSVVSTIASGKDPRNRAAMLIRTVLHDVSGRFEYGLDSRMTIEVTADFKSMEDLRSVAKRRPVVIESTRKRPVGELDSQTGLPQPHSVSFTWDRPFGRRASVMVVVSDIKVVVAPELFRDLGVLTTPGFPYLRSSAPAPFLRFNGRTLLVTLSRPQIWLLADQHAGDGRCIVVRGDIISKVRWARLTGRNVVEVATTGLRVDMSNTYGHLRPADPETGQDLLQDGGAGAALESDDVAGLTPLVYPLEMSMMYQAGGYDPPETPDGEPIRVHGATVGVSAESLLCRVDVHDTSTLLAVGSRLARLDGSQLSKRPPQPGRFDEWIDRTEDGDARLAVNFKLPNARLLFTDESGRRYIPIMEARLRNCILEANVPWMTNVKVEASVDLFNESKGWWEPGIERFPLELTTALGRSGSLAVSLRTKESVELNITPATVSGAARVAKSMKTAVEDLLVEMEGSIDPPGTARRDVPLLTAPERAYGESRPSVAAFCVQNCTGRPASVWRPYDSTRRSLRGDGGETEMDMPSDEVLWPALARSENAKDDPNLSRYSALRCHVKFTGYHAVMLSTAEVGTECIELRPDPVITRSPSTSHDSWPRGSRPLWVLWDVTMRDGVPVGCLRSCIRLINHTKTVLEVFVGEISRLPRSKSSDANIADSTLTDSRAPTRPHSSSIATLKVGGSWCVPVRDIEQALRLRPAVFHPPEDDDTNGAAQSGLGVDERRPLRKPRRVLYSYDWSDPLSRVDVFPRDEGIDEVPGGLLIPQGLNLGRPPSENAMMLSCHSADEGEPFFLSVAPQYTASAQTLVVNDSEASLGWVDIHIRPPLIIENLLPRPVSFRVGNAERLEKQEPGGTLSRGLIPSLRQEHVHTAGRLQKKLAVGLGYANPTRHDEPHVDTRAPPVTTMHRDILNIEEIGFGPGLAAGLCLKLDHSSEDLCNIIRVYVDVWIQNQSDVDLFFRDADPDASGTRNAGGPKRMLRGREPGLPWDPFVCFSGRRLALQRADSTEDVWVEMTEDICDIDKPRTLAFEGLGLAIDVRPAKGNFNRTLIVTIRNTGWIRNCTDMYIQWCQPAAQMSRGIALPAHVHKIPPRQRQPLHWDFIHEDHAVCLRQAEHDGSSEWIWSRPVATDEGAGEFAAKMYRPKRHEQYIARVVITKLSNAATLVTIFPEDRSTPPYRIQNRCATRSVAFRQSGADETQPWLVRPGRTTRYSWDNPNAPAKQRSLVVEVIDKKPTLTQAASSSSLPGPSGGRLPRRGSGSVAASSRDGRQGAASSSSAAPFEVHYPKFSLSIDAVSDGVPLPNARDFKPGLKISVSVDGPTKVVTFADVEEESDVKVVSEIDASEHVGIESPRDLGTPKNLDVLLFIETLGVSLVDGSTLTRSGVERAPVELAYLRVQGISFRLDRFDRSELVVIEVQDMQVDNQLPTATWPVAVWSPLKSRFLGTDEELAAIQPGELHNVKPLLEITLDGKYPLSQSGIIHFRGVFVALQQLQVAADEDFVLRMWMYILSLMEASGEVERESSEPLEGIVADDTQIRFVGGSEGQLSSSSRSDAQSGMVKRLYVEYLELCPLHFTISFASSRSAARVRMPGYRSVLRTIMAVLGNVENAEFRLNALVLEHVFDTTSHFQSLVSEFYRGQVLSQKMALLTSNPIVGNPSALFDSIAVGTRDFFVEPARAKGSAEFIAGIGRGSSSLLTNTVGGIVGSLGGIPRAVAQGLETAVGDREYLAERDSIRSRSRVAVSPAQGLFTGAMSFGHGIASGAAGLVREPVRGARAEGPSGFLKGLGKGFIGGVLKPITGALDLIGEPAVGFKAMMTTSARDMAESIRPGRSFWGVSSKRMVAYDLRSSLGESVLRATGVVHEGRHGREETLTAWVPLVPAPPGTVLNELLAFLWAVHCRACRSPHVRSKTVIGKDGQPHRADRMACALVTQRRLIVCLLDGTIVSEYRLTDLVDTNVSVEANPILNVGIREPARAGRPRSVTTSRWDRIMCGSSERRDELSKLLKQAIRRQGGSSGVDVHAHTHVAGSDLSASEHSAHQASLVSPRLSLRAPGAIELEMDDLSSVSRADLDMEGNAAKDTAMEEMKNSAMSRPRTDSARAKQGFALDRMPVRNVVPRIEGYSLSQLVEAHKVSDMSQSGPVRRVRLFIANLSGSDASISSAPIRCGRWSARPSDHTALAAGSVAIFVADSGADRVADVAGRIVVSLKVQDAVHQRQTGVRIEIAFVNPLLAGNSFAVSAPPAVRVMREGGDVGDCVDCLFSISAADSGGSQ